MMDVNPFESDMQAVQEVEANNYNTLVEVCLHIEKRKHTSMSPDMLKNSKKILNYL